MVHCKSLTVRLTMHLSDTDNIIILEHQNNKQELHIKVSELEPPLNFVTNLNIFIKKQKQKQKQKKTKKQQQQKTNKLKSRKANIEINSKMN